VTVLVRETDGIRELLNMKSSGKTDPLQRHFQSFRSRIIGDRQKHAFPSGEREILYADWAASGRLYRPIENFLSETLGPYVANTHTETTTTGTIMTDAYRQAHDIIKKHVNASGQDVLLFAGFGMTAVVNKFQRILGLRVAEKFKKKIRQDKNERPVVLITHMEHHSNQTTWEECLCDVRIVRRNTQGLPDLAHLEELAAEGSRRSLLIGSFTACSNVTGIWTPYHDMAGIMHRHGGLCFVDFSASAPYLPIDMHPPEKDRRLDAIFFSPHKFLGGPGSSGVMVFNRELYQISVPDQPGGGTVKWTNPWGGHHFYEDIETREDGGTPGFLQAVKASLALRLKEEMGAEQIRQREHALKELLMGRLLSIPGIQVLEPDQKNRIGYVSFYSRAVHHNLMVRLLNDQYGIQTRGGCSCAGTYGHILLNIGMDESRAITDRIDHGDLSRKPGWVRISTHPTMTDEEISFIADAVEEILKRADAWGRDYRFDPGTGDYIRTGGSADRIDLRDACRLR
jgi:selenocysteine lyase/cysteine desulfurase